MVVGALKSSLVGAKMMRAPCAVMLVVATLAACSAPVPQSGAGFQDYNSYLRDHGTGQAGAQPMSQSTAQPSTGFSTGSAAAAIDAAQGVASSNLSGAPLDSTGQSSAGQVTTGATGAAALPPIDSNACAGRGNAFAGIQQTTAEMNYVHSGVSDEQDFKAVTGRETIASDKVRIECNKEQYVVVQPGALPTRPGDEGPNIAAFALATTNPPGVKLYSRPPFYLVNVNAACGKFASADLAQQAFLAAGGPQRDSKGLDPDGDGFACSWDPRPFRNAKK